ncbi:lon protease homolog 2, peroxisomal [[Candida] railenensis]|uniref:Lon protease homolog 2, peroxisomal n=1 Tax=[Candida] railenensis TaxID=45579 RepID=A0A9P0VZ87_9ASCO|nr:lon protease homolog 2, peroxisomal [[Candida] railenensis]
MGKSTATGQSIVLPTYKLDSNLVLLPGIIYNVTFSRFRAATLLSRFRNQTTEFKLVRNLLSEYEFANDLDQKKNPKVRLASGDDEDASNPGMISDEAFEGIQRFVEFESKLKSTEKESYKESDSQYDSDSSDATLAGSEFDWLVLAISPNLDKISDLEPSSDSSTTLREQITTIVRIVGITDDTSSIRLTFQALTRGAKIQGYKSSGPNETLIEINWDFDIAKVNNHFLHLNHKATELFNSIDEFIIKYRQALNTATNLSKKAKSGTSTSKDVGDLFTLNPLANSLYLQLAGSKDFSKAYSSLNTIYSAFESLEKAIDSHSFLRIVDLTCAIMPFPNHQKLNLLSKISPMARIDEIIRMINVLNGVFESLKENGELINHWFYKEATNTQRANVVANQLKSIRLVLEGMSNMKSNGKSNGTSNNTNLSNSPANRQLVRRPNVPVGESRGSSVNGSKDFDDDDMDDSDDDLRLIKEFMKNKLPHLVGISDDAKRLIIKDFKRIKSAQPGNSDFHVIRNYLEIVIDLPWDVYVTKFLNNKDIDVIAAKKQLDTDHYGLEHVKNRLIQYLVVLKLLGINAESQIDKEREEKVKNALKGQDVNNVITQHSNKPGSVNKNGPVDERIVIANSDETKMAHANAREQNQKTKEQIRQEELAKIRKNAENMASIQLISSRNGKAPIILLAGPPGTGKTSLAKSIAKSLGRKFQRIALGGVRDEAEIRGHRRTYVGAMPGVIVQSLRKARSMNPVILLDEIDKVAGGADGANKVHGDPAAALLEVLDPEQNSSFNDHYLGFAVDLSQVIFICTANEPYNLSRPLLDRLEMIEVGAYDYNEKSIIGQKYLLPRQIKRNGFPSADFIKIEENVMEKIIVDYTREAGVRNFERKLGTICRHKAVEYAKTLDKSTESPDEYNPVVLASSLPKYLGIPYSSFSKELEEPFQSAKYGVVNGLSYNTDGSGSVLIFESIGFHNDKNQSSLNMTGRLGEVLMESAKIGLTFVKSVLYRNLLNLEDHFSEETQAIEKLNNFEIHLHVPSGAISKDGPSAGITMALSFLSLIIEKPVSSDIAMTGEITLRGSVLPIGGVKEKLLGAHFSKMKKVILPRENRKDVIKEYCHGINDDSQLNDLLIDNDLNKKDYKRKDPEDYIYKKLGIKLYYASEFWDVIKVVWGDDLLLKVDQARVVEYHL